MQVNNNGTVRIQQGPVTETVNIRIIHPYKELIKFNPTSTWIVGESAIDRLMKESFGATTVQWTECSGKQEA